MSKLLQIDGLPVQDAKRPITLTITETDITKAHTKAPNACAVARACARQLHVKEARVHLGRIYLRTNETNWVRYQTPASLRDEIIAFDRGGSFQPGEFRIKPIDTYTQTRERSARSNTTKTGKKRRPPHIVTDVRGGPA